MNELPDFWRTEIFHPLSVHFPIGLLLAALIFKIIGIWSNKETWNLGGCVLLGIGVIGLWIAIYTGNLADGIVSRKICDPTILKDHQNLAYTTAWIFSFSFIGDILIHLFSEKLQNRLWIFKSFLIILLIAGTVFLTYTGHLGATLVYQQGAGVYSPTLDCNEFN